MIKIIFSVLAGVLLFLLFTVLIIYNLNVPIAKGKFLAPVRKMILIINPPKDLFVNVIESDFHISQAGNEISTKVKFKYMGPYNIGLLLENYSQLLDLKDFALGLKVSIVISGGDNVIIQKETSTEYYPFWGGDGKNGLVLSDFNIPKEFVDKDLSFKIVIIKSDEQLNNKFGPVKIFIKKKSEL